MRFTHEAAALLSRSVTPVPEEDAVADPKFTPGPWRWEAWGDDPREKRTLAAPPSSRPGGPSPYFPDLGARVLHVEDPIENDADAALIAAAPDLYEACACALRDIRQGGKVRAEKLIRALTKAGGEP